MIATSRHRTDRTKGCVSRSTLLGLVYWLGMCAEKRWRRSEVAADQPAVHEIRR